MRKGGIGACTHVYSDEEQIQFFDLLQQSEERMVYNPRILSIHGGEHNTLLWFDDVSKLNPIKVT